ncbi:hypothetical protein J6590_010183 [Homalodisca vitripennis]|nr:hypothetical protein J6590_010183 [Homalodisca vitripennis]
MLRQLGENFAYEGVQSSWYWCIFAPERSMTQFETQRTRMRNEHNTVTRMRVGDSQSTGAASYWRLESCSHFNGTIKLVIAYHMADSAHVHQCPAFVIWTGGN